MIAATKKPSTKTSSAQTEPIPEPTPSKPSKQMFQISFCSWNFECFWNEKSGHSCVLIVWGSETALQSIPKCFWCILGPKPSKIVFELLKNPRFETSASKASKPKTPDKTDQETISGFWAVFVFILSLFRQGLPPSGWSRIRASGFGSSSQAPLHFEVPKPWRAPRALKFCPARQKSHTKHCFEVNELYSYLGKVFPD